VHVLLFINYWASTFFINLVFFLETMKIIWLYGALLRNLRFTNTSCHPIAYWASQIEAKRSSSISPRSVVMLRIKFSMSPHNATDTVMSSVMFQSSSYISRNIRLYILSLWQFEWTFQLQRASFKNHHSSWCRHYAFVNKGGNNVFERAKSYLKCLRKVYLFLEYLHKIFCYLRCLNITDI